jgi:integrase
MLVIDNATRDLIPYYQKLLASQSPDNIQIICDYIAALHEEINPSLSYRKDQLALLCHFAQISKKVFRDITRPDIIQYLDSIRRTEEADPLHKWVGTYNLRRTYLHRFFKWLYYPEIEPKKRPTPEVMKDIPRLKRKEQSIYKPTDLWTQDDDLLFLKYCPNTRDRCYHTISRDLSARPDEILKLKIKDIVFKTNGNNQYAEVLVNGKTGSRPIPLINSIPYVKDWLDQHPQRGNPNAYLIPSFDKRHRKMSKKMKSASLNVIYNNRYKKEYFPLLLGDPSINPEDKQKIRDLLKKPWAPYIRRHSALTEKSVLVKEHVLRQHAGWSPRSQMHLKYLHYFGNESSDSLLEAYGIVNPDERADIFVLKPKQCPNCNEGNKPNSKFCTKCRMVLSYDAYEEMKEQHIDRDIIEEIRRKMERYDKLEQQFEMLNKRLLGIK